MNVYSERIVFAAVFPVFEAMVSLLRSMASSMARYLGNDTIALQDRAKANHDLGKGPMVANPFLGNSSFLILFMFIALVSIAFSNFSNFNTLSQ